MTVSPPSFPRIPYLLGDRERDLRVPPSELSWWLRVSATVEEKLDGANVALWFDERGTLQVASRAGAGGMDRAGQLGRLRAWGAERRHDLLALLDGGCAVYGEWLWLTHSLFYDALPDYLVVLDIWTSERGWAPLEERDARAAGAALPVPPLLLRGPVGDVSRLEELTRRSAFRRSGVAEGAVLQVIGDDGTSRRAKWVRDDFDRIGDADWRGRRPRNRLARGTPARR
ncbi:MAG: RNA ligase family protein [Egibacteraceae bacterium]